MGVLIFLVVIAALGCAVWYLRRGGKAQAAASDRSGLLRPATIAQITPTRRPGRMVKTCEECCEAARRIESAWYPDEESPPLPLEACDRPSSCKCQWMRVLDRRSTHRRAGHDRRGDIRFEEKADRRAGLDRRKDAGNSWKQAP